MEPPEARSPDDLAGLKQYAARLEQDLADLRSRIAGAGVEASRQVAVIDQAACHFCGACASTCPANAIQLTDVATVNPMACTGCGACIRVCPADAIRLQMAD